MWLKNFIPRKTITHYKGNESTFLNMQEFKTSCPHEPILKKLLEEELSTYPRDKWKTIAKALGETLNLFKCRTETKTNWYLWFKNNRL